MRDDYVDVGDMTPAEVLRRLYNASWPKGLGLLNYEADEMTLEQAQAIVDGCLARLPEHAKSEPDRYVHLRKQALYFDYFKGRVLKIYLDERPLFVALYDRDNGQGAAARALGIQKGYQP